MEANKELKELEKVMNQEYFEFNVWSKVNGELEYHKGIDVEFLKKALKQAEQRGREEAIEIIQVMYDKLQEASDEGKVTLNSRLERGVLFCDILDRLKNKEMK